MSEPRKVEVTFHESPELPIVKAGNYRGFIITTKDKNDALHTFCAYYLNEYPLEYHDGCGSCPDDGSHEDGCPTTGWFYDESNLEYDHCYYRVSGEVIEWAEIPQPADVASAPDPRASLIKAACRGIADDYMTSDSHHPGYVLIPTRRFQDILIALGDDA